MSGREIGISAKEIHISLREIHKSKREIGISGEEIGISLPEIPISSGETTKPLVDSEALTKSLVTLRRQALIPHSRRNDHRRETQGKGHRAPTLRCSVTAL